MSDTPETDHLEKQLGQAARMSHPIIWEQSRKLERERDEARELVKAYQDYAQLLGDEINDMTAVAYVHGWRSNRYEQGKVLREKIKQLEEIK